MTGPILALERLTYITSEEAGNTHRERMLIGREPCTVTQGLYNLTHINHSLHHQYKRSLTEAKKNSPALLEISYGI